MAKTTEHKEGRATVKVVYYTYKTLADGSHPFMVRITKDRKLKYLATGLSLHPKHWNEKKKEIRKSYPEPDRENLLIDLQKWETKYTDAARDLANADSAHDAPAVAAKGAEKRKATRRVQLLAYIEELAAGMVRAGQVGNSIIYRDLASQLAKFIAAETGLPEPPLGKGQEAVKTAWVAAHDIPFDRVTVAFCNEWEATLRATGAEDTTLSNRFRTLRAVLNKAIANGVAKPESYPFARSVAEKHKFSVGKFDVSTAKRAISRADLRRLEALQPTTARQRLAKEVFLFSFYGGGINWVDLAQLRWRDLSGEAPSTGYPERLNYVRQKTGGKFALKLLAPAAAIVAAYRPFTCAAPDSYVFPILDPVKHASPTQVKNRLHKVLGMVNEDLKELGRLAGIATPLTTYVARHSMATTLRISGASTAVISQAMGHRSEATTAVYLDSFASELIDNAFDGLL
ncbi:site-specific integrase [Hymenobacter sp. BRD67]|uniref:site-specific integrase n=1 Tax=Hymenobacter sp. BRD67 TaxID=2675877 RepID=UPI001565E8F7|nr:site-specific integrase [Hymenobacter sp. BRD67]QKG54373.1 phage integrase SAM-like domain-containing protein [Hymenobacter sp. BRD67]